MADDKVTIQAPIGELAELFKDAPPLSVKLTYDEMTVILEVLKGFGQLGAITGNFDSDEYLEAVLPITKKFQKAAQSYLDKSGK